MITVAIDGPAGAGKSTIARAVAAAIGAIYVDTGALYRAIGYTVLRRGRQPDDCKAVCALLPEIRVEIRHGEDGQRVFLNGEDVSDHIRTPAVSMAASVVSAIPEVRAFLLGLQRDMAARGSVVMDGRDIGTVVLPGAQVKFFLTASPEERARRRHEELLARGIGSDFQTVLHEVKTRDDNDRNRTAAPLRPAEDAILLDTTGNTLEESIEQMITIVRGKML